MQGMGSDPEEFEGVSILVGLHERREINVNEMHDIEFNEHEEHSDEEQKCHLLYIHLHSWELRKLLLQNIFLMVKLVLSHSMKCCISKKKLNFKEKNVSYWYLTTV